MDRKYSRLLCRAIPNSSITCPPSPAIMRLRRVRFSNGATHLYWVRLYTAQYAPLTTGIGPHRLERMFNRFAQLASPGSLGFIGFGLAIFLSTISSNAASAQDKANKSTGSASRSSAADAELARLRADTIEKRNQTRAGTENLLALHEDEVKKLTAEYRQRQELYNQGLISRAELNQTERARAAAMI